MKQKLIALNMILVLILVFQIFNNRESDNTTFNELEQGVIQAEKTRIGKDKKAPIIVETYQKDFPLFSPLNENVSKLPKPDSTLLLALQNNLKLLKRKSTKKTYTVGDSTLKKEDLVIVTNSLIAWAQESQLPLKDFFDTYQIKGRDNRGNLKFTGYYTPIIKAYHLQSSDYPYPVYQKPKEWEGPLPTRQEIMYHRALMGKDLELAYVQTRKDIGLLQLQGSGIIEYEDGSLKMLNYGGDNKRRGSETFLGDTLLKRKNPDMPEKMNNKYVFFELSDKVEPVGAGTVPVIPHHSVAVDPRYIPLGACLLAAVPIINDRGRFIRHEFRIILAQDTGGAIKGPGRIDWYKGIGQEAKERAQYMSHYGKVWILMPKKKQETLEIKSAKFDDFIE